MDFELEFHAVGDATRAGDAITVRYNAGGFYEIIVIDGGTVDCGDSLVEHIRTHYGADAVITHVVSTHPDSDHASGLREIFRNFRVENLWIHGLWYHAAELLPYFADARWTADGLARSIKERYPIVAELIELAQAQGSVIREPFAGEVIGPFTVLSPTRDRYLQLVSQFRKTPECDQSLLEALGAWIGAKKEGLLASLIGRAASAVTSWISEHWDIELLREGSVTAAENESSTVLYGDFGTQQILLTADAGVNALHWACDQADAWGIDLREVDVIQVPHHGSRSNVTPSLLNRLVGPIRPNGSQPHKVAVVSCPADDEKHPRNMVVNAFHRRGAMVCKTQGSYFRRHSGMPARDNEIDATPFEWFGQVENYD